MSIESIIQIACGVVLGVLLGIGIGQIKKKKLLAAISSKDVEYKKLEKALSSAASDAKSEIAQTYKNQIGILDGAIKKLREDAQSLEIEMARQRKILATSISGNKNNDSSSVMAANDHDRTKMKRDFLNQLIEKMVHQKLGWVDGEKLIHIHQYANDAKQKFLGEMESEFARINAGFYENQRNSTEAIKQFKAQEQQKTIQSEIMDNKRSDLDIRRGNKI